MSRDSGSKDWEEIERAIAAFLTLPQAQGAAFLAEQPTAIRAEVISLLDAYRRSGDFLRDETGASVASADLVGKMKAMLALAGSGETAQSPVSINVGTLLGPYRIESVVGRGGMGVVYCALDTRLNRKVAVKFLFDNLADPAARRRFQREAQTASSLNHPHILTVHDVGDFGGRQYVVTEFVDGGTLKDWARTEKRTWREIVLLLVGVADGLAAAHAVGILHRDLKPDNILVGQNEYARLSDFGLAKLQEAVKPGDAAETAESTITHPGIMLGTIAYMSPEQATGRPTDARSDIFSFGILLYELLAGRRPFEGATDLEVLQTIIHLPAQLLGGDVPYALRMIVEKALEKDPADRYQSTRDLVVDLRRLTRQSGKSAGLASTLQLATGATSTAPTRKAAIALLSVLTVLAGGTLLWWLQRPVAQPSRQVVQFDIFPPPGTIFSPPVGRQSFAISPDGRRLAFTAASAKGTNIWLRDLASSDAHVVPGTEGTWSLFWPPDSRSIYFSVKGTLLQANLETGSGRAVAELPFHAQLGTWRPNGDLLLYLGLGDTYELRAEDGNLRKLPADDGVRWLEFLPDGNHFIYVAFDPALHGNRAMASDYLRRNPVPLMQTDSRVQYAQPRRPGEPGYLLFVRGASLLAQPFDAGRLRLAGEPFPIARNVIYYGPNLAACFSVSSNGVLVYQAGFPVSELKWYDRSGHELGMAGRPLPYWGNVRVSRDGRRVATAVWSAETGGPGVWVFDASGRESRQLTFPPEVHRRPIWSPDKGSLAVGRSTNMGGAPKLATVDMIGNGTASSSLNSRKGPFRAPSITSLCRPTGHRMAGLSHSMTASEMKHTTFG